MPREVGTEAPAEDFAHLPSAKLLTDLVEWWRLEDTLKWDPYGGQDDFPVLGQLWDNVEIFARSKLRTEPKNAAAVAFFDAARKADRVYGDPLHRGWLLTSIEARQRARLALEYLHASGLLSLRSAEKGAPVEYLSRAEQEGR